MPSGRPKQKISKLKKNRVYISDEEYELINFIRSSRFIVPEIITLFMDFYKSKKLEETKSQQHEQLLKQIDTVSAINHEDSMFGDDDLLLQNDEEDGVFDIVNPYDRQSRILEREKEKQRQRDRALANQSHIPTPFDD